MKQQDNSYQRIRFGMVQNKEFEFICICRIVLIQLSFS